VNHLADTLAGPLAAAAGVFAGTNIDDLLLLTVLFLAARAGGGPTVRQIWAGQYLGSAALVVVSVAATSGLRVIPDRWVGLLGLAPLALGLRQLLGGRSGGNTPRRPATGVLAVCVLTVANGADNIAAYTPFFRSLTIPAALLAAGTFAVLVAIWLTVGSVLGSHPRAVSALDRFGHWLVPAIYLVIGLVLLSSIVRPGIDLITSR
jgi:cadmium resistance protein CadD (predicted permease)